MLQYNNLFMRQLEGGIYEKNLCFWTSKTRH